MGMSLEPQIDPHPAVMLFLVSLGGSDATKQFELL